MTPYIYEKYNDIVYYKNNKDLSNYRLTLDTKEDFKLIKKIYDKLYQGEHDFYLKNIVKFLNMNEELLILNQNIRQKEVK